MKALKGWIKDILIACLVAVVIMVFIMPTIVKESSMEPTLYADNYIFLSKQAYRFSAPESGDIIVFQSELPMENKENENKLLIKRVIALPGDVITISDGEVYVNDRQLNEPYIMGDETLGYVNELTVPAGQVFVMGDNRRVSIDSRDERVGCVDIDLIVGKAFFRLYPLNRIGLLK